MRSYVQLHLTCAGTEEATAIATALLEQRLIVCAKQLPTQSLFRWQDEIQSAEEVLLVMDSAEDLFAGVKTEVARLTSYETFVLQMLPLKGLSEAAQNWMADNLASGDE